MDYLDAELTFTDDAITTADGGVQVMMRWEQPLMERMARIVTGMRGHVLEIGFGMGISCDAVQARRPASHTIVEAHPQILERAKAWAEGREDVHIVAGRWQEVLDDLVARGPFDGVSFDVFGGTDQRVEFFRHIRRLLKVGGMATLWLGQDPEIAPALGDVLREQGFVWRYTTVEAEPSSDCRYCQARHYVIPAITRPR